MVASAASGRASAHSRESWVRALEIGTCVGDPRAVYLQRVCGCPTWVHKSNACAGAGVQVRAQGTVVYMTQSLALLDFLQPENILTWLGPLALIGVIIIIFAECGLLIGFFLPGDSLLFITGLFIAQGFIDTPIWLAATLLAIAAVVGNATGYWIGYVAGPKLFSRPDSRLFKRSTSTRPISSSSGTERGQWCSPGSFPSCGRSSPRWPASGG